MTITEILGKINKKRIECIMQDRPESIPNLERLFKLAMLVDENKQYPNLDQYLEPRKEFYEVLALIPEIDRPFKLPS